MQKKSAPPIGVALAGGIFGAVLLTAAAALAAMAVPAAAQEACGEVVTLPVRGTQTIAYSFARPTASPQAALVLLAGGSGVIDLDDSGCARKLTGNSLVRSVALFRQAGFFTALVDAPSDHRQGDGLAGFRTASQHAGEIGAVIADVRARTGLPVFLAGASRGTISAANAASRLSGPAAADGLVLTSPVTSGYVGGRKAWVAQTVFDLPLEDIRMPVLVVAHAADICVRTPPRLAGKIVDRTNGIREQLILVTGGPGNGGGEISVKACAGNMPHGFVEQEAEVAQGMMRFLRGGGY